MIEKRELIFYNGCVKYMSNNEFNELIEFIDSLNYRCDVLKKEFINLRNSRNTMSKRIIV